ncbi:hypothetical protein AN642_03150 [Epulopiscium sp. SCG-B10WGA-EpuloA2]|nr:hypothetical protein AN642_02060 [Epulopiscium sp. SCG-B10WGA-EpuloA2]ONI46340.1 hypothetical protein AN642_03150 [Epulopiscium sp. SCG-B10WGA-EpuloA2]
MSGSWSDKNREGQEMRRMKRREGREYEEGNEGRARDERENLRKFFFFIPTRSPPTCFISEKKNDE